MMIVTVPGGLSRQVGVASLLGAAVCRTFDRSGSVEGGLRFGMIGGYDWFMARKWMGL